MKKQLYPDLTPLRVMKSYHKEPFDALVLYKNGTQYNLVNIAGKFTFHATEKALTEMVKRAEEADYILNCPLNEALK